MSTPLFIRTPVLAQAEALTLASADLYSSTGNVLIEKIRYANSIAVDAATDAGFITVYLTEYGGTPAPVKHVLIDAHDPATLGPLCGEIDLDLVLPDGWTLSVFHTVVSTAGGLDRLINFVADGGELG